jgi:hypothetical protein
MGEYVKPAQLLNEAADELAARGWTKNSYVHRGEVCSIGAIRAAHIRHNPAIQFFYGSFTYDYLIGSYDHPAVQDAVGYAVKEAREACPELGAGIALPLVEWNDYHCKDGLEAEQLLRRAAKRAEAEDDR